MFFGARFTCSLLDSEPGFSVFSFPLWIEFLAVVDQGIGLYSQNFYQNQRVLCRSIYIEPVLTSREECNVSANLFFKIYLCISRDCVNQHVFLLLDLHWDSPKLPWGMQRICGPFVFQTIIMPFKRLFVLWHSLIRSLYFIQVYIFIPLIHSAPFLRFLHILLYTNYYHAKYFSYPWWRCCSEFNHFL